MRDVQCLQKVVCSLLKTALILLNMGYVNQCGNLLGLIACQPGLVDLFCTLGLRQPFFLSRSATCPAFSIAAEAEAVSPINW